MAKVLHLLRRTDDAFALEVMDTQRKAGDEVHLLLLQDAVLDNFAGPGVVACAADAAARSRHGVYLEADYGEIVDLIFSCDKVISW